VTAYAEGGRAAAGLGAIVTAATATSRVRALPAVPNAGAAVVYRTQRQPGGDWCWRRRTAKLAIEQGSKVRTPGDLRIMIFLSVFNVTSAPAADVTGSAPAGRISQRPARRTPAMQQVQHDRAGARAPLRGWCASGGSRAFWRGVCVRSASTTA
jgi:hypothetical protein